MPYHLLDDIFFKKTKKKTTVPQIFCAGAVPGDKGGPSVKVARLLNVFKTGFLYADCVYVTSGAFYVFSWAWSRIAKRMPILVNQNGIYKPDWYPGNWRKKNLDLRLLLENASYVFYQSEYCREQVYEYVGKICTPSEILYNAIDAKIFSPSPKAREKTPETQLLVTGNFSLATADRLIWAIRLVSSLNSIGMASSLTIRGFCAKGLVNKLEHELSISQFSNKVFWGGGFSQGEAPQIYRNADIFLLFKESDSCPNTVIEAMACGCPVLYFNSGGVPELVAEGGIGIEIAQENPDEMLKEMMRGVCRINSDLDLFRAKARDRAKRRFSIDYWYQQHGAIIQRLNNLK